MRDHHEMSAPLPLAHLGSICPKRSIDGSRPSILFQIPISSDLLYQSGYRHRGHRSRHHPPNWTRSTCNVVNEPLASQIHCCSLRTNHANLFNQPTQTNLQRSVDAREHRGK
jgi:hypothetical protein